MEIDELEQLIQSLKSIKEATTAELQQLYKKYDLMGASGKDQKGENFLFNQNLNVQISDEEVSAKDIASMCEERGIKYDEKYNGRVKLYKASDETVDASGDIIRQAGWNFSRYKTNPVFAYCHNYYILPIGSGIKWMVKDGALLIYNMFALPEANPWADMCLQMVNAKMLNGNSVGFIPQKVLRVEDENERAKLGLGRYGVIFEKSMLLEDSACSIGCNPAALVQDDITKALQKGIVSKDNLMRIVKGDGGIQIPDSLKIAADCAIVQSGQAKTISLPTEKPEEKTVSEQLKTIVDEALKDLKSTIESKLASIESDMADIKSKINSTGNGGSDDPEAGETDVEKGLIEELLTGIGDINSKINI